jgi:hypothetical protein
MSWERELGDALRELALSADEVPDNPATERRLMEAFDARVALRTGAAAAGRRGAGVPRGAALRAGAEGEHGGLHHGAVSYLAAAASLSLLLGGGWWALSQRPAATPVEVVRSQAAPVVEAPRPAEPSGLAAEAALRVEASPSAGNRGAVPPRARRAAPNRAVPSADSADNEFVPLPAAQQLPRFESGMVVRVELPASSLPAYGFPIMPEGARTPVTADVLVGQDGQPRAIRLVSMQSRTRSYR